MKILIVHEVSYLDKIIYEYQILPEMLSMLGYEITVVDYDETWRSHLPRSRRIDLRTKIHANTHRAYPEASVTVRRPGMIRLPLLSRISGAITNGLEVRKVLANWKPDVILLYGLPTVDLQSVSILRSYYVSVVYLSFDV